MSNVGAFFICVDAIINFVCDNGRRRSVSLALSELLSNAEILAMSPRMIAGFFSGLVKLDPYFLWMEFSKKYVETRLEPFWTLEVN